MVLVEIIGSKIVASNSGEVIARLRRLSRISLRMQQLLEGSNKTGVGITHRELCSTRMTNIFSRIVGEALVWAMARLHRSTNVSRVRGNSQIRQAWRTM